eukprot:scaffold2740_cov418-Prasinococcus_capsulatus_cf.AAC.12
MTNLVKVVSALATYDSCIFRAETGFTELEPRGHLGPIRYTEHSRWGSSCDSDITDARPAAVGAAKSSSVRCGNCRKHSMCYTIVNQLPVEWRRRPATDPAP